VEKRSYMHAYGLKEKLSRAPVSWHVDTVGGLLLTLLWSMSYAKHWLEADSGDSGVSLDKHASVQMSIELEGCRKFIAQATTQSGSGVVVRLWSALGLGARKQTPEALLAAAAEF